MRILHAAAECQGFASTGGLGDVVGALPGQQVAEGHEACVVLPAYGFLGALRRQAEVVEELTLAGGRSLRLLRAQGTAAGAPVYLCELEGAFDDGTDPYRDGAGEELPGLVLRYARFSEAVAALASRGRWFRAQVVHLHDWHTALAAAWLQQASWQGATVLSIHNLAFQGFCDAALMARTGLAAAQTTSARIEPGGGYALMQAGIACSDVVTTVSRGYAREIQTEAQGCGLQRALQARAATGALHGIVNGIDERSWGPQHDPALAHRYGFDNVDDGKARNRATLVRELQLADTDMPMVAFIGRLTEQKGADLIAAAGAALLDLPAQYVVIGVGEAAIAARLQALSARAPQRIAFRAVFDPALARRLMAAADLLLMPSRFEPCGMTQMYALRYGTLPVVRRTGGLPDTIIDARPETLEDGSANGVLFDHADVGGVVYGVRRGLQLWRDAPVRRALQARGMRQALGWDRAAQAYLRLYADILAQAQDAPHRA